MSGHPVAIEEWTLRKRLPAHNLCLSHIKHNGKRRCLAVPESEAAAYLVKLDAFAADIARIVAEHQAREAARPLPKVTKAALARVGKVKPWAPAAKFHRHTTRCLVVDPADLTWRICRFRGSNQWGGAQTLHVHHTKRGRAFLVAHLPGDSSCPDVRARKAAEAAESEVQS